jgi:hypothetical protein
MNNTLHTPAPWKHDPNWGIIKHGKTEICALHSGNLANANLIASSPDLLSALRGAVAYAEMEGGFHTPPCWYIDAKCLIEKLGGEA